MERVLDDRDKTEAGAELAAETVNPLTGERMSAMAHAKLFVNPCGIIHRLNFVAVNYNLTIYGWIGERYGLSRPQFVVIFSLGLCDRSRARDIANTSGFPRNTLSRCIDSLERSGLLIKEPDPTDARGQLLSLTTSGRAIFDEAMPVLANVEQRMAKALSVSEQMELKRLLEKVYFSVGEWAKIEADGSSPPVQQRFRATALKQ